MKRKLLRSIRLSELDDAEGGGWQAELTVGNVAEGTEDDPLEDGTDWGHTVDRGSRRYAGGGISDPEESSGTPGQRGTPTLARRWWVARNREPFRDYAGRRVVSRPCVVLKRHSQAPHRDKRGVCM